MHPNDVDANLALANIYERLYRGDRRPELIEASDQAVHRVLANEKTNRKMRAEALALAGRNQKTRWRLQFKNLPTTEKRRKAAMNRALIRSYKDYREAFLQDLNHFYPGLAALQMGTILFGLAGGDPWYDAFDSDTEAEAYKRELEQDVQMLRSLIPALVRTELARMDRNNTDRAWAEISAADLLFMTNGGREQRIITAYADAIPLDMPFAWDSARGQLELFADLGVNAELSGKVIAAINSRFEEQERKQGKPRQEPGKPVHLLVLAGHRVDKPGRVGSRFPPSREDQAKALIREAVNGILDNEHEVVGLASAAPGTDILAHEVCAELGLPSVICLPMPAEDFARLVFEDLDSWRTRCLDLKRVRTVLELSDKEGLPRWLSGSNVDAWERGNRWVLQMALTWGAERITLVALWDGKSEGDAPGGTAHMVRLARDVGMIRILPVDANQLLG